VIDFAGHDWAMFLRPDELAARARHHGIIVQELVGLGPRAKARTTVAAVVGLRRRRLNYRQVSELLDMGRTRSMRLFYMGYAIKNRRPHPGQPRRLGGS
jgi:2-polyprenyl-6-hydroxyphenyl methylase / 3-demethylubiquinone-9 3-methyltransferase